MSDFSFTVEGKNFGFDKAFLENNEFTVNSVPRPYKVFYKEDVQPVTFVQELMDKNSKNLLLVDDNVYKLHFSKLNVEQNRIFKLNAIEDNKTFETVSKVLTFLQENKFSKGETLIVCGGGITEDIGAFVGAVYKRGIPWILLPTTLLSMCDSCIGGKTGINYNKVKNQLALFSAPRQVIIFPEFIKTLHEKEVKSGLGEILKLFVTGGRKLLDVFKTEVDENKVRNFSSYKKLILGALGVKKQIIEADEFELNLRKSLNYGHTLGHAIEVLSDYEIPHGQAVSLGMIIVDKLSSLDGLLPEEERLGLKKLALPLSEHKKLTLDVIKNLPDLLKNDKKAAGNILTFSFLKHYGETVFVKKEINDSLVKQINDIIKEEIYAI